MISSRPSQGWCGAECYAGTGVYSIRSKIDSCRSLLLVLDSHFDISSSHPWHTHAHAHTHTHTRTMEQREEEGSPRICVSVFISVILMLFVVCVGPSVSSPPCNCHYILTPAVCFSLAPSQSNPQNPQLETTKQT